MSNDTMNEKYSKLIKTNYPNFKFLANWDHEAWKPLGDYLRKVVVKSYEKGNAELRSELPDLIHDLEYFFYAGIKKGFFMKNNKFNIEVLERLNKEVDSIGYLPPEYENVFGHSSGKTIQVRRKSKPYHNYAGLNSKEVRRLYLYHELGHKILDIYQNEAIFDFGENFESVTALKGKKEKLVNHPQFLVAGTLAIEECLTQELGENFAFYVAGKPRPSFHTKTDLECQIRTNHDFYCIFEQPVINLGKTLNACADKEDNDVLTVMIKKALSGNFLKELINEYNKKDNGSVETYKDLMDILYSTGILCAKKYANFGQMESIIPKYDDRAYAKSKDIKDVLNDIEKKTKKHFTTNKNSELNRMLSDRTPLTKPRNRGINETDEAYNEYLRNFYNNGYRGIR